MYRVYLGGVLCPVAPEKISTKYGTNVSAVELADGSEAVKGLGKRACEIEFSLLLPNVEYPFAAYIDGFRDARFFLEKFKGFLEPGSEVVLLIIKEDQSGKILAAESARCVMESLQVIDDAAQGVDVVAKIKLRELKGYTTKQLPLDGSGLGQIVGRPDGNSPAPKGVSVKYRVVKGDCLWMIAKRFYGDGNLFPKIRDANQNVLKGRSPRCLIFVGDELEIPPL